MDAADLGLLERLRAGDAGALEALMAQYGARVYRVAYGITRNEADAEEIVERLRAFLLAKLRDQVP